MLTALLLMALLAPASAQATKVPSRQIPPAVLVELQLLENRFELALASDCSAERCYSKGCAYLDHAVADQPRSRSLPGLSADPGPGSSGSQEYLTRAQCSFATEAAEAPGDVQNLVRRLQARLTSGWTVVTVDSEVLQPLAPYLREAPVDEEEVEEEPEVEPVAPPEPEPFTAAAAGKELWAALLPHFYWMVGLGLATLSMMVVIWSGRRMGVPSPAEQALLAQLSAGDAGGPGGTGGSAPAEAEAPAEGAAHDAAWVTAQQAAWHARLEAMDPLHPDPELQALVRELLRGGEHLLLAKAVLRFPDSFLATFPVGGEVAAAKLELARILKTVDTESLPSDVAFFEALERHALSAALLSQGDTRVVASLGEDFGAAGLAELIGRLPARLGALLFALTPPVEQHELVPLLREPQIATMADQLLRSNRMDPQETETLFEVLRARPGELPTLPQVATVSDRGAAFDATGALAVLLGRLSPERRASLFAAARQRSQGTLPAWHRGILVGEMLLELGAEARNDLMLSVEVEALAAWLSLDDARAELLATMPSSLQSSVGASSVFPSRARQLALAARGRQALARGFQLQLARQGRSFEEVVTPQDLL